MHHPVKVGDLAISVRNHREIDHLALGFLDIQLPAFVAVRGVDGKPGRLDVALFPFRLQSRDFCEFRGTNRREIPGVAE